jgi:hypothetical protein
MFENGLMIYYSVANSKPVFISAEASLKDYMDCGTGS